MINQYLLYIEKIHVLICRSCQHGLLPGEGIRRHLHEKHQKIPLKTRRELISWANELPLVEPDQVLVPGPEEAPIEGLELIGNGFKCKFPDCLNPFITTPGAMKTHYYTRHKGVKKEEMI